MEKRPPAEQTTLIEMMTELGVGEKMKNAGGFLFRFVVIFGLIL
jgi:hypothetical protein